MDRHDAEMDWLQRARGSPWIVVLGIVSSVWGLPGMLDSAATWHRWVGSISTAWSGVLVGAGGMLVVVWLFVKVTNHLQEIQQFSLREVIIFVLVLAGGGVIALLLTIDRPSFVWTHPKLTLNDQEKVLSECRMRAYEAIGEGSVRSYPLRTSARAQYISACLTSEGFELRERTEGR